MRKIFARLAQGDSDDGVTGYNNLGNHQTLQHSSTGRRFKLGNLTLSVEEVIAEGGFGVVFRVLSQFGHVYALKRTCVSGEQDLAVCKREITIVSSISHKNILCYVDSKITNIEPGIYEALLLTVYYPGNLSQIVNKHKQCHQRFTEVEVLRIFGDVCEAVCRLHHCKTPIIHRDLKIENMLIDSRKNCVLCDFGSATSRVLCPSVHGFNRCQDEIERYTTLSYRAPEMVNLSESIPLGLQIDIWALGCLLYCLCFFNLPFGESVLAIQSGIISIPDWSPYREKLHKLIGYILCVDAFKRPDIYQVCALVFSLNGHDNPAQNLNRLSLPLWKDLTVPPRESQLKALSYRSQIDETTKNERLCGSIQSSLTDSLSCNLTNQTSGVTTTVTRRERPRAITTTCTTDCSGGSSVNTIYGTADTTTHVTNMVSPACSTISLKPPPPIVRSLIECTPANNLTKFDWKATNANDALLLTHHTIKPSSSESKLIDTDSEHQHQPDRNDVLDSNLLNPVQTLPSQKRGHYRAYSAGLGVAAAADDNHNTKNDQAPINYILSNKEFNVNSGSTLKMDSMDTVIDNFFQTGCTTALRHVQSLTSLILNADKSDPDINAVSIEKSLFTEEIISSTATEQCDSWPVNPNRLSIGPGITTPLLINKSVNSVNKKITSMNYAGSGDGEDEDLLFGVAFDAIRNVNTAN